MLQRHHKGKLFRLQSDMPKLGGGGGRRISNNSNNSAPSSALGGFRAVPNRLFSSRYGLLYEQYRAEMYFWEVFVSTFLIDQLPPDLTYVCAQLMI
jgi:hypothetical protein